MEIITEALIDTGKLVPFLAAIYFVVGLLEYRYGDRISHILRDLKSERRKSGEKPLRIEPAAECDSL